MVVSLVERLDIVKAAWRVVPMAYEKVVHSERSLAEHWASLSVAQMVVCLEFETVV